ncbi:helix-turn-helix transcriptional regulator [Xylella fastidiosa subsp. fastidiosa]|uniref:helix-turn-helix transcriptional regulator n=1 Tax=Xylella fastidiosa TaxID=2371 RepID=UPI001892A8A4|nr:helix-turn-helix transcriptional regulator [Xylella fastidiosa]QPC05077.1 helix-turn-helix transcriptional regulator [Xylella fastidiosa subsp. fastidiosa]QPC07227.1 helix-turn-helix transcriptional regulator [Xylella fastidiosa subsp. fastidiosa]
MSKLSERVREARNLCSLTQEALASDLGVTRSAVAQWEMEQGTKPSVENLIALARRTGMAFEYLSTDRGKPDCGKPISSISEPTPTYQKFDSQQKLLLEQFAKLTPRQRSGLLELLGTPFDTLRR